jgi:hypothetical protein
MVIRPGGGGETFRFSDFRLVIRPGGGGETFRFSDFRLVIRPGGGEELRSGSSTCDWFEDFL